MRCFLDTNIWLYAFIRSQHTEKTEIAKRVIQNNEVVISTQVINEVCINLIKKASFDEERTRALIASFYRQQEVVEPGLEILLEASSLRSNYSFSFWDSLIVSSAVTAGASVLYSEDMHDGLFLEERLRIENPFSRSVH